MTMSEYEGGNNLTPESSTRMNTTRYSILQMVLSGSSGDKRTSMFKSAVTRSMSSMQKTSRVKIFNELGFCNSKNWLFAEELKQLESHRERNTEALKKAHDRGDIISASGDNLDHQTNSQDSFQGGVEKHQEVHELTIQSLCQKRSWWHSALI